MGVLLGILLGFCISAVHASPVAFPNLPALATHAVRPSSFERNELCVQAHLESFVFEGLRSVRDANYCESEVSALPDAVRESLERIILIQKAIAHVIEIPAEELFGANHRLVFRGNDVGSIGSETIGREVRLAVLPDWTVRDFPAMIYAHEAIHALYAATGPLATMLPGLSSHPLLSEALPDLISAAVFNTPAMLLGETRLPPSMRRYRDATSLRSLNEPFRNFYRFADLDAIRDRCRSLELAREVPAASSICARAESAARDAEYALFRENELAQTFRPEHCLTVAPNGLVLFDRCVPHQFSHPLLSLFFRVRAKTGRHTLGEFLRQISAAIAVAPTQECRFYEGTVDSGGVAVTLKSPSLADAFRKYRSKLSPAGRTAFDLAWQETGFRKFLALDHLYRTRVFNARAAFAVAKANDDFAEKRGCGPGNLGDVDTVLCRVECREKTL
jgi:hypothetical protein